MFKFFKRKNNFPEREVRHFETLMLAALGFSYDADKEIINKTIRPGVIESLDAIRKMDKEKYFELVENPRNKFELELMKVRIEKRG